MHQQEQQELSGRAQDGDRVRLELRMQPPALRSSPGIIFLASAVNLN